MLTFTISFFFSSRRRHTSFKCDWSSDVCSSDLELRPPHGEAPGGSPEQARPPDDAASDSLELAGAVVLRPRRTSSTRRSRPARSEEVRARLRRLHAATSEELERRSAAGLEP